ncbi:MAG: anti-sigma factor antagonist [Actinomycetota bacterium]|jgi:anti-anti-sigma factor|nr:anti-sigma factor antagonist [Actinomycetota bacterium]MDQ1665365.1 anti-sigma factor antagonist [Actinomycetota bacterium]
MSADLLLSMTAREGCAVVTVGGEVDLGTANQLSDYAVTALQDSGPSLVIDLAGVTFMDSTGLKVLLACHRRVLLGGGGLGLVAPTRPVLRVLSITGLDQTFPIYPTVDETITALSAAPAVPRAADQHDAETVSD